MDDLLQQAGLSDAQAQTYLYLLQHGEMAPPAIAEVIGLTRSNAYKVLDALQDMGLISRREVNKKFVYRPEDPRVLSSIVASERNRVNALEQSLGESLGQLRSLYEKTSGEKEVQAYHGSQAVIDLLEQQATQKKTIYAIRPSTKYRPLIVEEGDVDLRKITPHENYATLVEWRVVDDELTIITLREEVAAIRIKNPTIAQAFRDLWPPLDSQLESSPQKIPPAT